MDVNPSGPLQLRADEDAVEVGVEAAVAQQLGVGAPLHDAALVEHQDLVGGR